MSKSPAQKQGSKTFSHNDAAKRRAARRAKDHEELWLFGIHAVQAVLEVSPHRVLDVVLEQEAKNPRLNTIAQLAEQQGVAVQRWKQAAMFKRIGEQARHQGVLARCRPFPLLREDDLKKLIEQKQFDGLFLLLDEVTDPHNLGACLRSADAFGVNAVIVPEEKSARLSAVVCKVAVGGAETVPLYRVAKTNRAIRLLKEQGVKVVGTAISDNAQPLSKMKMQRPLALVMGAEGEGLKLSTIELCDELVYLPMQGYVDSLNVSVATGVFLQAISVGD